MTIYLNSHIEVSEDGTSSRQVRDDSVEDDAPTVAEGDLDLADEPRDGEKSLKSQTKAELVDVAKGLGVPADVAENLTKAELLESISRMTHTSDD